MSKTIDYINTTRDLSALEKIAKVAIIAINKRPSSLLKISAKEQSSSDKYEIESKRET